MKLQKWFLLKVIAEINMLATWSSWIMYFSYHLISYYCRRNPYKKNWCYSSYFPPFTLNHISHKRIRFFSFFFIFISSQQYGWLTCISQRGGMKFYVNVITNPWSSILAMSTIDTVRGKKNCLWQCEKKTLKDIYADSKASIKKSTQIICFLLRIAN